MRCLRCILIHLMTLPPVLAYYLYKRRKDGADLEAVAKDITGGIEFLKLMILQEKLNERAGKEV